MKRKSLPTKEYYRVKEIIQLGYPTIRTQELGRKIGRHENPEAGRNSPYLLTLEEVKQHFGY